jgi:outer membrane protein TolC
MTKNIILPVIAICLALNPCAVFGQEEISRKPMRISPDEAVELAIKNNLGLEQQRVGVSTKQRAHTHAWNSFLPTITLSGGPNINSSSSNTTGDFAQPDVTKQTQTSSIIGFQGQLQVQFTINFALFEAVKYLRMDYETGRLSFEQAKLQMERDIRKSYFNMMLMEEQIKQLQESRRNAEEQARSAETQYRAGRQPELNYLQARVNVETMKPSIDQAVSGLKLAKSSFAMTLGLPLDTDFDLSLPVENIRYIPLDTQDLIRRAKGNNPDIQVQAQQLQTLMSQRKAQTYQKWTPNLSLGWAGGFSNNNSDTGIDTNIDNTKLNQNTASTTSSVTLGLSWTASSLLPFSRDAQSIKDLDDSVKTASIALAQAEQSTELDITNKVYSLEQIRANIEAQQATAALAERSYNETLRAYNSGLQNLLQVQTADLQLRNARLNLYQQESNYLQGLIDLEYTIGAPFGSLMTQAE